MKTRAPKILDVAPFHLVLYAAILFMIYTNIPPAIYSYFVGEPDWMYLNLNAYINEAVFISVFCLGLLASKGLKLSKRKSVNLTVSKLFHYAVFLLLAIEALITIASFYVISQAVPDLVLDFLTSNGEAVKDALYNTAGSGSFEGIIPVGTATILWIFHIYGQPENIQKKTPYFYVAFYGFITLFALYLLVTLTRSSIIVLALGIMVQHILRDRNKTGKGFETRWLLLVLPLAAIGLFILLGSIRGVTGLNSQISTLLGYGPASYNRQALVFSGQMDISGVWITHENFGFLTAVPFLSHIPAIQNVFGTTTEPEVEYFSRVTALAGLNPQYVWPGVFGSIFGELGYFGLAYVFMYGFLTYEVYKRARVGLTFGVVVYCFIAWSILFWSGFNNLLSGEITYVIIFLILARLLERLTFKRSIRPIFG